MSRNRLDEIVEEEARVGEWFINRDDDADPQLLGPTMKRIAERAFRHGVEQDRVVRLGMAEKSGGTIWFGEVQPAPAEEKRVKDFRAEEFMEISDVFRVSGRGPILQLKGFDPHITPRLGRYAIKSGSTYYAVEATGVEIGRALVAPPFIKTAALVIKDDIADNLLRGFVGAQISYADNDRRKGERRESLCDCGHRRHEGYVCNIVSKGIGLCECCAGWIPAWMDRRSGNDRRKKNG